MLCLWWLSARSSHSRKAKHHSSWLGLAFSKVTVTTGEPKKLGTVAGKHGRPSAQRSGERLRYDFGFLRKARHMKGFAGVLLLLAASSAHGQGKIDYDGVANNMDAYKQAAEQASGVLQKRIAGLVVAAGAWEKESTKICSDLGHVLRQTVEMRINDGLLVMVAISMDGDKPADQTRHYRYAAAQIFHGAIRDAKDANEALDKCLADYKQ